MEQLPPTPRTLALIPAALSPLVDHETLFGIPLTDFLSSGALAFDLHTVVKTVAAIRRVDTVGAFCDAESEQILVNRFSLRTSDEIRSALFRWLLSYLEDEEDDDDADDDFAPGPLGRRAPVVRIVDDGGTPHGARPPAVPAIEAPPSEAAELGVWAEHFGVRERLADRIDTDRLRRIHFGLRSEGLPESVGEAALVKPTDLHAPSYVRRTLAAELASFARDYLHRAAQATALLRQQLAERAGRARKPQDPVLLRFSDIVQRQRDGLRATTPTRPVGTYVPGEIRFSPEMLLLAYSEWSILDKAAPNVTDRSVFHIFVSAWEGGGLEYRCLLCREPSDCPHALTAFEHLLATLQNPNDPLAAKLVPVLRVPSWSRLLDYLDRNLAKEAAAGDTQQRLVWDLSDQPSGPTLSPVLQKQVKRGGWSRGQRVRLEEIEHKVTTLDAAEKATLEALNSAREPHAYYGMNVQSPRQVWRGLATLVGSARVFADAKRSTPISVRKVRPALRVEPVDEGFRLHFLLGTAEVDTKAVLERAKDHRHVVWFEAEHQRCLLALVDKDVTTLLAAMARFPAVLPAEAVVELIDRIRRTQPILDLHLPEVVRGERVEPASAIVCRLEPLSDVGLTLAMVVRPIAGGPIFAPGDGPPEILHARDGRHLHAMRALASERERAAHVANVLGLDDSMSSGVSTWNVSDDEAALVMVGKLRELGDLVEVEWPAGEIRVDHLSRAGLKVTVRKRRDWFGAEGGVAIDGANVSLADILAAIRAGRRYVKVNANRFAAIEDELRERLAALDDVVFDNQGSIELGLLAAPILAQVVEDPRQLDLAPAFKATLGKLDAASTAEIALPEGLQASLRHYQDAGFRWLSRLSAWGLGACLADDMGLGKTVQAIALLLQRAQLGPALIIAPTSVVANWVAECAKFAPGLTPHLYRGPERAARLGSLGKGSLLITSYAIAVRDAETLAAIAFSTLIVDEAQAVKNALTQRFRAIRDLQADFRVALTGTPIENHLGELWAIFRLVTPGLLGPWEQFRQRFAVPIERHKDRARQAALARVVQPFLLRRTKAEVAPELPPRTEMNHSIELGPAERRLYEAARVEVLESLAKDASASGGQSAGDDARQRIKILAALTRLRLLCCHPRLVVEDSSAGSAKLAALVDLLTELRDEGHRALVFSQFTSFLDLARPLLFEAGLTVLTLDGSTPAAVRDENVRAFQAGEADVFLLSLRAGGTGLNLTAATYVIHLDPWWNPAVEDQATDRAHRIGQERPVTVIRLVARGTIEEQVLSLHEEKRQLAASILDGADVAGRLGSDELIDLIRESGTTSSDDGDGDDTCTESTGSHDH